MSFKDKAPTQKPAIDRMTDSEPGFSNHLLEQRLLDEDSVFYCSWTVEGRKCNRKTDKVQVLKYEVLQALQRNQTIRKKLQKDVLCWLVLNALKKNKIKEHMESRYGPGFSVG